MRRTATLTRETRETSITIGIDLDTRTGRAISTTLPFFDHMLDAFACHGGFGLIVAAQGDVNVDPHHLVEDCGIVLGQAIGQALTGFDGIERAGCFSFPMDGSLAEVAVDLCGRPNLHWQVPLLGQQLGGIDTCVLREFFKGLADGLRATVHIRVPYLDCEHHAVEAVFKAFGRSIRMAIAAAADAGACSTKGVIDG